MHTKSCWSLHLTGESLSTAQYILVEEGLALYSLICVTSSESHTVAKQLLTLGLRTDCNSGLQDQAKPSLLILRAESTDEFFEPLLVSIKDT